jgi:APA family basic amino acid/polyamine antiporter
LATALSSPGSETSAVPRLKPTLGLVQLTVSGLAIIIGAGIYVLIGDAAAQAGNMLWLSLVLAATMSALTGLSYAELGSMYPTASAEYEFARQAFNRFFAFMAGWLMLVGIIIAAATVSLGFGQYAGYFYDVDPRVSAIALLVVLTGVVIGGVQRSIWLTVGLVVLQVGGLVMVAVAGLPHAGDHNLLEGAVTGVLGGTALVFFAFIGFDEVITLSEDTKDPARTVPRALILSLAISTVLYVLVGIAAVSAVGSESLASSDRGLALVMEQNWGSRAADVIAFIALASTTNTTLLILTTASRLMFGFGQKGELPAAFSSVSKRTGAPYVAALGALVAAVPFVALGRLDLAAATTDLAIYLVFIVVNLAALSLRWRKPDAKRPFRSPGQIGRVAITPVLALISVAILMTFLEPSAWLIGGACVVAGALLWWARHRLLKASAQRFFNP